MLGLRVIFLLALSAVAVVPASAHAGRIPECHLFSTSAVGHATGYRGVRVKGSVMAAPSMTRASGSLALCSYASGTDSLGQSSVMTLRTAAAAAAEFAAEVKADAKARRLRARSLSGPWPRAYAVGHDEIYVLKGHHVFFMHYQVKISARAMRGLAETAAKKL